MTWERLEGQDMGRIGQRRWKGAKLCHYVVIKKEKNAKPDSLRVSKAKEVKMGRRIHCEIHYKQSVDSRALDHMVSRI